MPRVDLLEGYFEGGEGIRAKMFFTPLKLLCPLLGRRQRIILHCYPSGYFSKIDASKKCLCMRGNGGGRN
jgi:hypothetical protein